MIWIILAASGAVMTVGSFCWIRLRERRLIRRGEEQMLFFASLGHELKTPLNSIIGFADLLQSDAGTGEDRQEFIRDIRFSADTLLAMVNNLLDCAKLDAGQMRICPRPIRLTALAAELPVLLCPLLREKNLRLEIELSENFPTLELDPERLRQILLNLVGNAVKFSERGVVTVRGEFLRDDADFGTLTLRVIDQGDGIAQECREVIFAPFVQQGRHTGVGLGSGLGLSITKRLVELMDGTIGLESEPGKGSCFIVTLPRVRTAQR